jgi:hypothetical protein
MPTQHGLLTHLALGSSVKNCTRGVKTMIKLIPMGGTVSHYIRIQPKQTIITRLSRLVKKVVRHG